MTFKEYLNLLSTLKSLKAAKDKEESEEAMVPIGKFALFRGKVQKPTRLFFDAESNGQLKEIEITQAIAIVEGKLEGKSNVYVEESLTTSCWVHIM